MAGEIKMPCDFCGLKYSAGPGLYEGKKLSGYEAWVFPTCYHAGDGGWNQVYEPRVLKYLEAKGIEVPERQSNGFLPKEFWA
tara:strand:+ start:141 stop:386 length:246 start_codon:yes stop_codon:yes gene_type:complete